MSEITLNEQIKLLAREFGKEIAKKANKRKPRISLMSLPEDEEEFRLGFTYIPSIPKVTKSEITYPKGSRIVLSDGCEYKLEVDTEVNLSGVSATARTGKDCYVWAGLDKETSSFIKLEASLSSASFTNLEKAVVVGGFHGLCKAVGTIAGHTLNGYQAGDILPNSIWTPTHRPISDPEGMVWCPQIGKWADIYLPSWDGEKLVSVFNGTIADGASSKKFHGTNFAEFAGLVNKELISYLEFAVVAQGSNVLTNITGSTDPTTTGGHVDTSTRRMISNFGLEDCCGVMWLWSRDIFEFYPNATKGTNLLNGYTWDEQSVYYSIYGDTTKMGMAYGLLRRPFLGGNWSDSSSCGPRCALCNRFATFGNSSGSSRFVSSPKPTSLHPFGSSARQTDNTLLSALHEGGFSA